VLASAVFLALARADGLRAGALARWPSRWRSSPVSRSPDELAAPGASAPLRCPSYGRVALSRFGAIAAGLLAFPLLRCC